MSTLDVIPAAHSEASDPLAKKRQAVSLGRLQKIGGDVLLNPGSSLDFSKIEHGELLFLADEVARIR